MAKKAVVAKPEMKPAKGTKKAAGKPAKGMKPGKSC